MSGFTVNQHDNIVSRHLSREAAEKAAATLRRKIVKANPGAMAYLIVAVREEE